MLSSREISLSLLATSVGQSNVTEGIDQPKPAASSISCWIWDPITNSFFGTQPRITQVPPMRYSSATTTRAPWPAAIRAARTPPEPPPMTNRSTSNSAIAVSSDLLAALAHLGAEFAVDRFAESLRPLVHVGHAELDRLWLRSQQFLAERRLVERHQVLQFLLGELAGINVCHSVADFLLPAAKLLIDDHRNFIEILLIVQIALHQLILGLLHNVWDCIRIHRARVFHGENFLGRGHRGR